MCVVYWYVWKRKEGRCFFGGGVVLGVLFFLIFLSCWGCRKRGAAVLHPLPPPLFWFYVCVVGKLLARPPRHSSLSAWVTALSRFVLLLFHCLPEGEPRRGAEERQASAHACVCLFLSGIYLARRLCAPQCWDAMLCAEMFVV